MPEKDTRSLFLFLCSLFSIQLICHFLLLPRLNIHWDEFHFLSVVYAAKRGELQTPLQTFHAHLFSWLTALGANEVETIVWGRRFMFVLLVASYTMLFKLLADFGKVAAAFAIIAIESVSQLLQHGAAFRFDPLIIFLFTASLLAAPKKWGAFVSGCCFALALMSSLKAGLFLAFFWAFHFARFRPQPRWWLIHSLTLALVFTILFSFHPSGISQANPIALQPKLVRVAKGYLLSGLSEAGLYSLANSMKENLVFWILTISGLYLAARGAGRRWILIGFLSIPLLLFYRNAWPYFIPLALLPLVFSNALFASWSVCQRHGQAVIGAIALLLFTQGIYHGVKLSPDRTVRQRAIVTAIHQHFHTPVPYIDRCAMISSFPSAGQFLTSWQIEAYKKNGTPVYGEIVKKLSPRFLIANSPFFFSEQLHEEDAKTLRENFVHWQGEIYFQKSVPLPREIAKQLPIIEGPLFDY